MTKKSFILSLAAAAVVMSGCGGGSSDPETNTGTGFYIDSAVSGVSYACGSESGVTGEDGSFIFEVGKDCTFKLGDITLRAVDADNLVDRVKIVENDIKVARMLQTLDKDGNPDNGITIDANVVTAMKAAGITALPDSDDKIAEVYEAIKSVEGYTGEAKTIAQAEEHLAKAQSTQLKALLAGKTFYRAEDGGSCNSDIDECTDGYIEKTVFNAAATSVTWTELTGETQESGTATFSIEGNRLNFPDGGYGVFVTQTNDYLVFGEYDADGSRDGDDKRFYFSQAKAEAYLESLKSEDDGGGSSSSNADDNPINLQSLLDGQTWGEYKDGATTPKSCYTFSGNQIVAYFDGDNTEQYQFTYLLNNNQMRYMYNGAVVSSTDTFTQMSNTQLSVHKVWSDDVDDRVWRVTPNCTDIMESN